MAAYRLVAHFLDDDHRRFLVEHLVDRDHLAELHQRLDDFGGLDRHLVREVGDGDRLGHEDFADHRSCGHRLRGDRVAGLLVVDRDVPPLGPRQPVAVAPPVVSPRSRSARRRAASSWNT